MSKKNKMKHDGQHDIYIHLKEEQYQEIREKATQLQQPIGAYIRSVLFRRDE